MADPMIMAGQPADGLADAGRSGSGVTPDPGGLRDRVEALRAQRTPFVQATVVRAVRPTSAKAGDRALVIPDGTIEGFVGGTCAESSVRVQGLRVLRSGEAVVLRIVPEVPDEEAGQPDTATEGLVTVHNPCASGGMLEIFLEAVLPPPLVQVCGDAPIARALRDIGVALGYDIRPAGPGQPVAADAAAVVVASHGRDEEPLLTEALRAGVPYVGLVASRRRGAQVVASLDVTTWDRQRVHTPAGLDIGAQTPQEVALSVYAQIVAERRHAVGVTPAAVAVTPVLTPPSGAALPAGERPGTTSASGPAGAAGPELKEAVAPDTAPGHAGEAGETTDPVCGMTVAMAQATPHLSHDGHMWYFCGPGCRQAFSDDPARYLG